MLMRLNSKKQLVLILAIFLICVALYFQSKLKKSIYIYTLGEQSLWKFCPAIETDENRQFDIDDKTVSSFSKVLNISQPRRDKYVVWRCDGGCGGFADRLRGIVSGYIWAWILNRKFVIRHTKPCPLWIFYPNHYNWNQSYPEFTSSKKHAIYYKVSKVLTLASNETLEQYDDVDVILFYSNLDSTRDLMVNPKYLKHFKKLSPVLGVDINRETVNLAYKELFTRIFLFLFKLNRNVRKELSEFLEQKAKPDQKTMLVCAQLRVGGDTMFQNSWVSKYQLAQMAWKNVISKIPGITDGTFFTLDNGSLAQIWRFLNTSVASTKDWRIYLMTDSEQLRKLVSQRFSHSRVVDLPGEVTHIDRSNEEASCLSMRKMIQDWYVMTQCDRLLLTEGSKYGILASWLREWIHPYNLRHRDTQLYVLFRKDFKIVSVKKMHHVFAGM